ncbi:adhesion G protein-coupled receptor E3-like [Chanodichthys erythropterus]|uniref:adhesion G protein-coupled receptor E3-like n=1 Tax=Chanodichthys erythropterus TaxID=933992 RepID=UPI00351E179E
MYCNTRMHDFNYQRYGYQKQYQYECMSNNCDCIGNKDTCTCYSSTLSSCFCESYRYNISIPTSVSLIYNCVLYNDTYICTGAQYCMYCNTRMHDFNYQRYVYQNQYEYQCWSYNCDCIGNEDTCTCYSSTLSSCFCETYSNNITIPTAHSPATVPDCVLYNDTYICTGAQYCMYCNTRMHDFNYQRYGYQNQYQYECMSNNCYCIGNKDTCTCSSSTLSSCFCETYGDIIDLTTSVSPIYDCVLYNDTYICTGAQYRMYCNTSEHYFYYQGDRDQNQYKYGCWNNNCDCYGNEDTCTCYTSILSSCFCETYGNNITIPTSVSPVYDCVLYNDTYICTGAQYRMYCNTRMHDLYSSRNKHHCMSDICDCTGNKDTCTCYSSTISSCFCEYNISTPTTHTPTTTGLDNILDQCRSQISGECLQNLLDNIENITDQVLPLIVVTTVLDVALNTSKISESADSKELVTLGNSVIKASEKLISSLVTMRHTSLDSFTLFSLEVQVPMIGPKFTSDQIHQLYTKNASMDIDLVGLAKRNNRTTAVAFMSYTTMENLLKPELFNTSNDTIKTMMSTVISATLPKTTNTKLTKPVNFTLKHIREFDPSGSLSCVYWNISEWIVDGCSVLETNSSYTVCSCVHLSTFALIMQTSRPPESDPLLERLNLVFVSVGLVFFSLALLTFALCQWSPGVNNVARINICISLLLAHLLFLLTQQFLSLIRPHQVSCAVISGVLHFLFLSGFVWMFIEAVLLFICVKNLSQISSNNRVLSSRYLCVIGYTVALVVVGVSAAVDHKAYDSKECWIKMDKGFIWSFLGPVAVILALNMILFICIIISLNLTLKNLNAEVSQMKQTKIMTFKALAQFVVLGCSWILGFFTNGRKELEILFLILNSQQGTFIFMIYCVLNNEVRKQYRKWVNNIKGV